MILFENKLERTIAEIVDEKICITIEYKMKNDWYYDTSVTLTKEEIDKIIKELVE